LNFIENLKKIKLNKNFFLKKWHSKNSRWRRVVSLKTDKTENFTSEKSLKKNQPSKLQNFPNSPNIRVHIHLRLKKKLLQMK
jgi:hypothetical protein